MLDALIKNIESAFVEFSVRRLLSMLFILATLAGALVIWDRATDFTVYTRLSRRLALIEQLNDLRMKGADTSHVVRSAYWEVVAQLRSTPVASSSRRFDPTLLTLILAMSGGPLLFMLFGLAQMVGRKPGSGSMAGGAFIVSAGLSAVVLLIPKWGSTRAMSATYFGVQILIMVALWAYGKRNPTETLTT